MGLTMNQKQAVTIPVSKGGEKSKVGFAGRVHPADRLSPEIRSPPLTRRADQGNPGLPGRGGGEAQAGKETAGIWCKKENVPFTRSRDRKKNGNYFAEQKNGAVVSEYADSLRARYTLYNPAELQQNASKAVLRLRQRLARANRKQTREHD
jgi:hypothetical protein